LSVFLSLDPAFSQVSKLFGALDKDGEIQDDNNREEEGQVLINQEENTEMTPIIVTLTD